MASALVAGYLEWVYRAAGGALKSLSARDDMEVRVAFVGTTVREGADLVAALLSAGVVRLHVDLLCPLGDKAEEYGFLLNKRSDTLHGACTDLRAELTKRGISQVNVSLIGNRRSGVADLTDHMYDIVLFGPLGFGIVDHGSAVFNPEARANLACAALKKSKAGVGLVVMCNRDRMEWQHEIYHDRIDAPFGQVVRGHLQGKRVGDGNVIYSEHPIQSKIHVSDSLLDDLETFVMANTYGSYWSNATALSLDAVSRIVQERKTLEEQASIFIVSWQTLPSNQTTSKSVSATSAPSSPGEGKADGGDDADSHDVAAVVSNPQSWWPAGLNGEFVNVGENLWERQRLVWQQKRTRSPSGFEIPERAAQTVTRYEEVISGLASLRRTFELPHPMPLNQVIDIYLDIWESCDNY